jgi:hypothetical protein
VIGTGRAFLSEEWRCEQMNVLDWSRADDVPATPTNTFLLQGVGGELIFVFGHAPPPMATTFMSKEERMEYIANNPIPVQQVVKLTMTVDTARNVMETLQLNLKDDDDGGDDPRRTAAATQPMGT